MNKIYVNGYFNISLRVDNASRVKHGFERLKRVSFNEDYTFSNLTDWSYRIKNK